MDFKLRTIQIYEGITKKGNQVSFPFIEKKNLRFYEENLAGDIEGSKIDILCNFIITASMAHKLHNSKIVYVQAFSNKEGVSNAENIIEAYPLLDFSWESLTDVLHDMSEEFNL